jgi:putative redox protein
MPVSKLTYLGELRSNAIHLQSGSEILTDAPKDNQGKGEAFSPTDLTATSLAACIITVIGITAQKDGMAGIEGAEVEVDKVMYASPRRIGEIHVRIRFPEKEYSDKEKLMYERAAHTCPVSKSLHPDIKQVISFVWP